MDNSGARLPINGSKMDRFDSMSAFLEAANAGSLSAAARAVSQPLATVSRKVAELEAHLGTILFTRTSRGLLLTDSGRAYLQACKRILEDVEAAELAASGEYLEPKGDLTITAPIVFGRLHVVPLVMEFLTSWPGINIRLVLADRVVDLAEDHVDVAVRIGELPDSSLVALRLGQIRRVTCGSPAYFARYGMPAKPQDVSLHFCIARGLSLQGAIWEFAKDNAALEIKIRPRLMVSTAEAAIDAALSGQGITRAFSYQTKLALVAGKLAEILQEFEPSPWPVSLVYHRERVLPQKLRMFIDFAAPRLRAQLDGL